MKSIKQLLRLIYINHVLAKNGLDQVIVSLHLFAPIRLIVYLNPWNWFRKNKLSRGEALRKSLEELGPIFVKFGQTLSTRPDIIPNDIAIELTKLQDNVPPFKSDRALTVINEAYGRNALEIFAHFEPEPLASASIAQVHAATLHSGEDVVVKILRPDINKIIDQDLAILYTIAKLADRYWKESRRFKPKEVIEEFERNLINELDMRREAANAQQLRRNFKDSKLLYIPEIYWDYVRENILVSERIYGIPVSDIETLNNHGINLKKLAENGVEIFFTQVFTDCFFHADMHPGNIFVSMTHKENPQYISVDFGIIGTLNDNDKRYLAENLLAFFNRDYRRIAQLHVDSGWVARDTRIEEFEADIRTLCEPIFEKPFKDISFALLILQLFQVARRFNMEVQPQLVLLQKTLLAVEGLGRQLSPELNLWVTAKPFLENWIKDQIGPKALIRNLRQNIPFLVEQLPFLPSLLFDVLELTKEEKIAKIIKKSKDRPKKNEKNLWSIGIGFGVFLALTTFSGISYFNLVSDKKLAMIALGIAEFGGLFALIKSRSPR